MPDLPIEALPDVRHMLRCAIYDAPSSAARKEQLAKWLDALLAAAEESIIECEGCAELRAALSGRTVSCAQCETLARERDELRRELTRISEEGHGGNTLLVGEIHDLRAQRDALRQAAISVVEFVSLDKIELGALPHDLAKALVELLRVVVEHPPDEAIRRARGEG
jgi:hypothetical protein